MSLTLRTLNMNQEELLKEWSFWNRFRNKIIHNRNITDQRLFALSVICTSVCFHFEISYLLHSSRSDLCSDGSWSTSKYCILLFIGRGRKFYIILFQKIVLVNRSPWWRGAGDHSSGFVIYCTLSARGFDVCRAAYTYKWRYMIR